MSQEMAEDKFTVLRRLAEEMLQREPADLAGLSAEDVQALVHNLQVHQIELELQNEELQRVQLDLQAARDRYADLYNFAPVGYFTLDANGAIVEANLTGAALLNVPRSALIGTPLARFVAPEDRDKYAVYRVGLETREEPQTAEVRLTSQAGTQFYARLEGLAAFDGEGRLIHCRLTVSDITERKRAEEVLWQASRLEVAKTLAGGIAHDINNLMTTVLGNAELLRLDLYQPEALHVLATISRAARRASELAQQMLAFARGGKYHPRLINLNDIILEALPLLEGIISPPPIVERQLASDLWCITADASQISQVMVNLVTNAVEASDGRERVFISTANRVIDDAWFRAHPGAGIGHLKPGQYVNVTVADTGQGVSAEVLARVFEPFFTTKFQGRGMGLAAVYGIIQNHGGNILIESKVEQGTVVTVYLPAVPGDARPVEDGYLMTTEGKKHG